MDLPTEAQQAAGGINNLSRKTSSRASPVRAGGLWAQKGQAERSPPVLSV